MVKIISLSLIFLATNLLASEYAVISKKPIKGIDKSKVKALYLKKLSIIDESKIVPVNLEANNELRLKFEKKVLNMSFSRLKAYWTKQHYLGNRPPISMKSPQSIKAFVKKVDGAIGYIPIEDIDKDIYIIYKWSD